MSASASRRALLCGVVALPALTLPTVAAPSALVAACEYGIQQRAYINGCPQPWDDERLNVECDKLKAVFSRAIAEPSGSLSDVAAKARLMLDEIDNDGRQPAEYDDERLIETILREIASFEARAGRLELLGVVFAVPPQVAKLAT